MSDWRWEIEEAARAEVSAIVARIDALGGEVVKSNPKRDVLRIGDFYVKKYRLTSGLERLKHVFVPSKAKNEFLVMKHLRSRGVATAEPLAWGERGSPLLGESAFVSRAVPGARSFARVLDDARAGHGDRRQLVEKLAALACALLRAGADHRDLHIGNVLLDAQERATIIDLHAVSLHDVVPVDHRFERLARLALSLGAIDEERALLGREEVEWFARAAASEDKELGDPATLASRLEERARALLARHLASRDKRCLVDSKTFAVEHRDGRSIYRRRDFTDLDRVLAAPADELLHRHARGRSTIERVGDVVRKTEDLSVRRSWLGAKFTGTRARRAWRGARALEVRELPHPRALALVEEGRRAFFFMDYIPDAHMVHVYLETVLKAGNARKRQALAKALGALVAHLHARGLVHRDLAVQNVLLREKGEGFELFLLDTEEIRVRSPSDDDVLRALVQVADLPKWATRSDLLRGLRSYLREGGVAKGSERELVARISRALVERAEDKARRARMRG